MANIVAGKINVFYYASTTAGRLKGVIQAGETDLSQAAIALPVNVNLIYGANSSGGYTSFVPGSSFPSLTKLEVGVGYFVDAKTSFVVENVLPRTLPSEQTDVLAYLRQAELETPIQPPSSTGYQLGINLTAPNDYSPAIPFVDLFKTSRQWISGTSTQFSIDINPPLDANGNATAIPATAEHIKALMVWDLNFTWSAGQYLLLYDGTANISYSGNVTKNVGASTPGRDVLTIDTASTNGIELRINRTSGNTSQPELISIRNIRLIPASAESTYQSDPFNPAYLSKLSTFHTLRFMDMLGTNDSSEQLWANRPKITNARWTPASVELCVDFCNKLNKDGWFCIPHKADDNYIQQFATVVRDRLNPNLKVIVEYSNEVWNFQFSQAQYAIAQSTALWGSGVGSGNGYVQWMGRRTVEIRRIWRSVWGAQSNRVKVILCNQAGYLGLEDGALNAPAWIASGVGNPVAPKTEIDAYGFAPYFDGSTGGDSARIAQVAQWADEGEAGFAKSFDQLRNGTYFEDGSFKKTKEWMTYHKGVADSIGKEVLFYECGQSLAEPPGGTQAQRDKITAFYIAMNKRPEMGQLYIDYFTHIKNIGVKMPMVFADISTYTKFGCWGLWENVYQSNATSPKATAVNQIINTLSGT